MKECHIADNPAPDDYSSIILAGNPNVGKSVIFQHLTGTYVTVSNYPGTTVDISTGNMDIGGKSCQVIDTPGTLSLIPRSEDERVTRDVIMSHIPRVIIQVGDSKNPRRTLDLTLQLLEMGHPMILVLNMGDEAKERGIIPNPKALGEILRIPVIQAVAVTGHGINTLKKNLANPYVPCISFFYSPDIEQAIKDISSLLPETVPAKRRIAVSLLAGDSTIKSLFPDVFTKECSLKIDQIVDELEEHYSRPLDLILMEERLEFVESLTKQTWSFPKQKTTTWNDKVSRWTLHPVWGMGIALMVLLLMYLFVGSFAAGTVVDLLENALFGKYIIPFVSSWVKYLVPGEFLQQMLVGEYGLFTMAITYALALILPIVTAFFLFFGVLEDSGYLPRLAVVMDRIFRKMGLNGKAVLPMVLGLGCDTMATLTARILETKRERIITTLLLTLAIPCSAQLGVILGMLGGLSAWATIIWVLLLLFSMIVVGYLASKLLPGENSSFILEIPPFRMPKISNLIIKTLVRLEWYLKEAVPMFAIATFLLFILHWFGLLEMVEKMAEPLVSNLLGLPKETSEAFLIGFLRRDYGAAGLYSIAQKGLMNHKQILVSLVTITLFVPCVAQFLVNIKERGLRTALLISLFVLFFAFAAGGLLNLALNWLPIPL
jgi:ferrous iron transport protein B